MCAVDVMLSAVVELLCVCVCVKASVGKKCLCVKVSVCKSFCV